MEDSSDLRIAVEQLDCCQIRLTVEVPEERVQQEMRKVARRIARQVNIPGFRKGKAPYGVVVQRYGERAIRKEVTEELMGQVYQEVLEREKIVPYDSASLEAMESDPFRFTVVVPLPPVVELREYRSLRVEFPTVQMEEEVGRVLKQLREEYAVLEPVEGRGAQPGDVLVISAEGRAEDGTIFLKNEETEVVLDLGNERPAPGFHEALVGMAPEEERTFRLKMPDAHPAAEAEFTVRLEQLSARILPDVDDDLARTVGDFDSLAELERHVEEQIGERKQKEAEEEYVRKVVEAVIEQAKIEYPPAMLERELDELMSQFKGRVQRELRIGFGDYLKATDKTEEQLRSDFQPQAKERLRQSLVLGKFAELEGLTVGDEETEQRIADLSQTLGVRAEDARKRLQSEEGRRGVVSGLLVEKAIDRLTAIARGEVIEAREEKGEAEE